MRRTMSFRLIFSLVLLLAANSLSAAVIERDWKTPGDGLLTYDTVNKREWLDLSQTLLSDQFPGTGTHPLEIRESRYQYVIGQTAPGGLFEGFTVARSLDVIDLAHSAGIDVSTNDIFLNSTAASALLQLLGPTRETVSGSKFATGLLDEFDGTDTDAFRLGGTVYVDLVSGPNGRAGIRLDTGYTQFPPSAAGVFLYQVVPEPISSVLLGAGLILFVTTRKWKPIVGIQS